MGLGRFRTLAALHYLVKLRMIINNIHHFVKKQFLVNINQVKVPSGQPESWHRSALLVSGQIKAVALSAESVYISSGGASASL